ncbi:MAG: alpha-hydroxy acid oxidase [Massilia sp.]
MTTSPPVQQARNSIPPEIACAQDYEQLASRFIALPALEYIAGGSGTGATTVANRAAFARWAIMPRILRDVAQGHTRLALAGSPLPHPVLLAPVAFQKLVHPGGETESARAARALDAIMVSSTLATVSLEDIAQAAGQHWFQLYFQAERAATLALLRRAEAAGCGAIVVTLDALIQTAGSRALQAGFRMPPDCVAANLAAAESDQLRLEEGESRIFQGAMRGAPSWADLAWLQQNTALPLWVKGVLHPDDARQLQVIGVAGIVVSNHGGRGLDGAPASLDALPAVRSAVGPAFPLLFDGGIRSGADIFKAIALGADAVMVGRLQMYALAVAGALGVAHMLKCLREELEVCMALAGCATLDAVTRAALWPEPVND